MGEPYVVAGSPLDRVDFRRRDDAWLAERIEDPASKYLAFWRLQVLVRNGDAPRLAWATSEIRSSLDEGAEPVFVGVTDGAAHFAANVSEISEPAKELGLEGVARFSEVRAVAGQLPSGEAAIVAQGRSLVDWHGRHRFCAACGAKTRPGQGGYLRVCTSSGCASEHFPRTDPVVIMLVVRGERCLLGRQPVWPRPFFSALAGFVEPGETIEEAVRREVREETGISVAEVRYHSSQPWPFPSSLMIGCTAEATSEEVRVDAAELEDARWFSLDEVRAALRSATEELAVPPAMAIAHQLLRAWATREPRG
jgi:NAD+ diphosphatase